MMLADLGGAPLGVAAGPWNCLGFESYCCNVQVFGSPNPSLVSFSGKVDDFFADLGGAPCGDAVDPSICLRCT